MFHFRQSTKYQSSFVQTPCFELNLAWNGNCENKNCLFWLHFKRRKKWTIPDYVFVKESLTKIHCVSSLFKQQVNNSLSQLKIRADDTEAFNISSVSTHLDIYFIFILLKVDKSIIYSWRLADWILNLHWATSKQINPSQLFMDQEVLVQGGWDDSRQIAWW